MSSWFEKLPRPQYSSLQRLPTNQPWFDVYAIRPSVLAFYEPHQCEEVISYLIIGSEKSLLIDTGMGIGNLKELVKEFTSTPLLVINTHTHNDHVGDNWRFEENLIGLKSTFGHKDFDDLFRDAQDEVQDGMVRPEYLPDGFDRHSYRVQPFSIKNYVNDGDHIDLGDNRKILVIETPGHTPDSLSFLDINERLLFVGDLFYEGPIFLYRPETNLSDYIASLKRLIEFIDRDQVDFVVPSHNTPMVHPNLFRKSIDAINDVIAGRIIAKDAKNGLSNEYDCGDFSFIIRPESLQGN